MNKILVGIDTGGTFTDFVLLRAGRLYTHKVLSTPQAPEQAILQGLAELDVQAGKGSSVNRYQANIYIVHGSTVATNAVLEGKGVRTAFITNRGLGDMLTIGRQTREELYNLQPKPVAPPVARELCLETGGRLAADGQVVEALSSKDLEQLRTQLEELAPKAVAINLLFSYLDADFEKAIEAVVPEGVFVSRSSKVLPEFKEYERGITTWLNAYVGPLVQGYLARLCAGVPEATVSVMQSSGGTIAADQAGEQAVHMLLSGPAGGVAGAQYLGQCAGRTRLLTFDMGGTSTDVAMIDGELQLTNEGKIGRYPVAVPMVDMHTIGAGGGSIASVDAGGMLQVGPGSAGAQPGPACYGQGGIDATVTDANLVLGRLRADAFLGGRMSLDEDAAQKAVKKIGQDLGLSVEHAAEGIIRIANEHMAQALRVMSVQRGIDPRELTLVSFGGAGGLHVCALAESLGMQQAMVPIHAGVLSALGMLVAPRARQLSKTYAGLLADFNPQTLDAQFDVLIKEGADALQQEGVQLADISIERTLDLRYAGQSYFLNIPWQGIQDSTELFHQCHAQRYGHQLDLPVELVNVRVALRGPSQVITLEHANANSKTTVEPVTIYGEQQPIPVHARDTLAAGETITGPALITETVSTTWISLGWQCVVDEIGNLVLELNSCS